MSRHHPPVLPAAGLALALLFGVSAPHPARANAAIELYPQVAVTGVWDFARPRQRTVEADMHTPAQQAETTAVAARLAQLTPAELHIARPAAEVEPAYAAWLSGERKLAEDSIEQIGFRVVKATGLQRVAGIGAPPTGLPAVIGWGAVQASRHDVDWQRPSSGSALSACWNRRTAEASATHCCG